VRVRSVLVFITDPNGRPLASVPGIADLRATENGVPVEIVALEPLRVGGPANPIDISVSASTGGQLPTARIPHYVYIDTTALNMRSLPIVSKVLAENLDSFLETGPLAIIVADPQPEVIVPETGDKDRLLKVLRTLPSIASGKERLLSVRRDSLREIREVSNRRGTTAASQGVRMRVRMAVTEEIALLKASFSRLEAWAADRSDSRPGVLYLCNDGFDADPVEVYRNSMSAQDSEARREMDQLSAEFSGEVAKMLARATGTLGGKGLTTVPIALGGVVAEFAGSASNFEVRGGAALRRPTDSAPLFFYERPLEPLGLLADATGGEVVSGANRLPTTLEHVAGAYLLTFRVRAVADGRPHPFAVSAVHSNLAVRAPAFLLTGTPSARSIHRAVRVLERSESPGDVPVKAALGGASSMPGGRYGGLLRIAASFGASRAAIEDLSIVRIRLSIAVGISGSEPFTTSQEVDWRADTYSWLYAVPLTWPADAQQVAVLVEEVSTGLAGSAVVPISKGP
jgi:hypothetical protein